MRRHGRIWGCVLICAFTLAGAKAYEDGPRAANVAWEGRCFSAAHALEQAIEICDASPHCSSLHSWDCHPYFWRACWENVSDLGGVDSGTSACTKAATAGGALPHLATSTLMPTTMALTVFEPGPRVDNAAIIRFCSVHGFGTAEQATARCLANPNCTVLVSLDCQSNLWVPCFGSIEDIAAAGADAHDGCSLVESTSLPPARIDATSDAAPSGHTLTSTSASAAVAVARSSTTRARAAASTSGAGAGLGATGATTAPASGAETRPCSMSAETAASGSEPQSLGGDEPAALLVVGLATCAVCCACCCVGVGSWLLRRRLCKGTSRGSKPRDPAGSASEKEWPGGALAGGPPDRCLSFDEVDGCFSSGPLEAPGEDCCSDFGSLPAVPWELPDDDLPKISPAEMSDKDHADLDKLPPVPWGLSDDDTPETDSLPSFPPPELTAGSEVTRRSSTPGASACCNEVPQEPPPLECGSLPSTAAPSRCSLVESNPGCQEGPGCPECDKPMIWSLYSQGDYDIGWMCQYSESCGASEVRPCVPRWFCQGCHVDVCGACRAPPAWGEHEGHCSEALGGGLPGERRVSPWGGPKEPPEERPSMQVQRSVVQRHAGP